MKITTRGRYAVMAMVLLASAGSRKPIPIKGIAKGEKIPEPYLQQLFVRLRRRDLVRSVRGPGGGFVLARPAGEISIGEVIRSAEGTARVIGCRSSGSRCGMIEKCKTQNMWETLEMKMDEFLDSISLADLHPEKREVRKGVRA